MRSQLETKGQTEIAMPVRKPQKSGGMSILSSLNDCSAIGALAAIKEQGNHPFHWVIYGIDGSLI